MEEWTNWGWFFAGVVTAFGVSFVAALVVGFILTRGGAMVEPSERIRIPRVPRVPRDKEK